jgi:type IV pilus assembly protein PilB
MPLELLVRFGCVPVGREDGRLMLAFGGLDDFARVDEAEFHLGRPIEPVVAPAARVNELLKRHRGGEMLLEQASEGLRLQLVGDDEAEIDVGPQHAALGQPGRPTRGLADPGRHRPPRLRRAHRDQGPRGAREVPHRRRALPRPEPLDKRHHETIISRIKVMSELDIAEKRVPQDGRFRLRVKGRTIDFRVSIMPSIHGEDAVIRILDKESLNAAFRNLRLDVLGFGEPDLRKFRKYITEPYGWWW